VLGIGINKQDIVNVIHFGMPQNFECYQKEIGRACRNKAVRRAIATSKAIHQTKAPRVILLLFNLKFFHYSKLRIG
jgi:hypothetical protein